MRINSQLSAIYYNIDAYLKLLKQPSDWPHFVARTLSSVTADHLRGRLIRVYREWGVILRFAIIIY